MSLNKNNSRLQKHNAHISSDSSTDGLKLYNLLFAGKISMKEYLRKLAFTNPGERMHS